MSYQLRNFLTLKWSYKMKKTLIYLALTSCFVLSNTVAHANPGSNQGNMQDKMLKDMDTNSDGMVTKEEFNNYGEKKFIEMDVNGDGKVTDKEMKTAHKKMDGSGSVRNKMDDEGKDSKGKERSTNMSGDMDHSVSHGDSDRSQSERTRIGSSRNSGQAGDAINKAAAAPGKVLNQDRLKIECRDDSMNPTGNAGQSCSPSGS
jgi:hypothetical protein